MVGLNYNVGEWSEIYALLKLVDDASLYSADSDLNKLISEKIEILHAEKDSMLHAKKIFYVPDNEDHKVLIFKNIEDLEPLSIVCKSIVKTNANKTLDAIKNRSSGKKGAFDIPSTSIFLKSDMEDPYVKANSFSSSDIDLKYLDENAVKKQKNAGFSIKSELGGDPTVFNASGSTNVIYKIQNFEELNKKDITEINSIVGKIKKNNGEFKADVAGRVRALYSKGCYLEFKETQNPNMQMNFEKIDSALPQIYAELLIDHFLLDAKKSLSEMTNDLKLKNKSNLLLSDTSNPYERKIKKLLSEVWLGMTAGKKWCDKREVDGGFIFVKKDGDLVCYHISNWSFFENYLYTHARLDTPSATKHKFGEILGDGTFKLNCSIRHKF